MCETVVVLVIFNVSNYCVAGVGVGGDECMWWLGPKVMVVQ